MAYTIMMMMLIMITMIIMRDRAARWPSRESGRGDPTDGTLTLWHNNNDNDNNGNDDENEHNHDHNNILIIIIIIRDRAACSAKAIPGSESHPRRRMPSGSEGHPRASGVGED